MHCSRIFRNTNSSQSPFHPSLPGSVPSTDLRSNAFKELPRENLHWYRNVAASPVKLSTIISLYFLSQSRVPFKANENGLLRPEKFALFCILIRKKLFLVQCEVLPSPSGHRYDLCMNDVCHEVFTCVMRKVTPWTIRFVAHSVTDYSTYVNFVANIENWHVTLSTGMYRQI